MGKLRRHRVVESYRLVSDEDDRYVYLVKFSENQGYEGSSRSGVDNILSTLKSELGGFGYDAKKISHVYDDSTVPSNLEYGPIESRQRLVVFDF